MKKILDSYTFIITLCLQCYRFQTIYHLQTMITRVDVHYVIMRVNRVQHIIHLFVWSSFFLVRRGNGYFALFSRFRVAPFYTMPQAHSRNNYRRARVIVFYSSFLRRNPKLHSSDHYVRLKIILGLEDLDGFAK